ncbi:ATP-dependent nuclease [Marinomonas mediterranea]|uniref:ATP-dependent nuclease n=1 Tax=Marinomonas mediterranea TaxID=119864 RepID=UPI00234BF400|nr:AAA family ATPase [Marinomonas mediterranea]WCN09972.1 AAA family ATPase [Marinomonas mediterranea]
MKIDHIALSNFRCFPETLATVPLEADLTCLVGNNGTGKTTLIMALKRLFGSSREDRTVTRDDFYLAPDEDYKSISGRELFVEVIFSFPELKGDTQKAREVCPAFSSVIYADEEDGKLKARMRLEALWDETEYEDEVQSKIYWVTTSKEVEFGEGKDFKSLVSSQDRKNIKLRYIPAFRDSKATLKNEVKALTKILEDYTNVSPSHQRKIETISSSLSDEIQNLEAIKTTTALLKKIWNKTHDKTLKHYQYPKLEATPTDIGELLRSISIKLAPSEDGGCRDISELSDGQISLLYFTLAIALYEIEQEHHAGKTKGFKELDKDIPVFTIFAFEEPENHLSPFYLGRILDVLHAKTKTLKATSIVTSHSTSVVRRMERVEQIRHFRQKTASDSRYSVVKKILLPSEKSEEDYKYINQAVLAHPELYFSKLVLLGEGESEEIVIPQLAETLGFDLDPSFVAFVKLGGRHVNHMWRLLSDLDIPFLTLIDLDLGRNNAGQCRIEYAIGELRKIGKKFDFPKDISAKNLNEEWLELDQINELISELEKHGVFFSFPLDLDMGMIRAFPECYNADNAKSSDRETLDNAVLGKEHEADNYDDSGEELYSDEELKKYRYLFCTKSKVASHYKAMADILELDEDDIETECPDFIKRLIEKCSALLRGADDE